MRVPLSSGETVVRVPSAEGRFAEGVRVDARQTLTVREIIARHQAAAARQRRAIQQLISTGTMTLTFEAPSFPAPMAITSRAIIYTAPDATDIEQRDIRVNGIAFAGGRVPRLPLHRARARRVAAAGDRADRRLFLPPRGRGHRRGRPLLRRGVRAGRPQAAAVLGHRLDREGQLRDGQSVGRADRAARADCLVRADRRIQPGRGRSLAAGALGGPSALRRRRFPYSDSSRARHRTPGGEPAVVHRAPPPGLCLGCGHAARYAAGVPLPGSRARRRPRTPRRRELQPRVPGLPDLRSACARLRSG